MEEMILVGSLKDGFPPVFNLLFGIHNMGLVGGEECFGLYFQDWIEIARFRYGMNIIFHVSFG